MWFVTSVLARKECLEIPLYQCEDKRTFGYFTIKQDALNAIRDNTGNMEEAYYNFLVLEWIDEGIHALADKAEWFKWDNAWVPAQVPEGLDYVINWAIG